MMHGREKSDLAIGAAKPANNDGRPSAELVEQRAGAEGNAGQDRTRRAQNRASVSKGLDRVRHVSPSDTQGGSRVPELGPLGSVRGALSNHPWLRERLSAILTALPVPQASLDSTVTRAAWTVWQAGLAMPFTLPHTLPPLRL